MHDVALEMDMYVEVAGCCFFFWGNELCTMRKVWRHCSKKKDEEMGATQKSIPFIIINALCPCVFAYVFSIGGWRLEKSDKHSNT